jgi:GAF domain-containing protein
VVRDSLKWTVMTDHLSSDGSPRAASIFPLEPSVAFGELARIKLADNDLKQVLSRVAELAKACIPGASEVSVTLINAGTPATVSFTGELADVLDEKQYDLGYGPCLDAARDHRVNLISDMAADERWPAFAANALQLGIRSSLSAGIPVQDAVSGALNVYSTLPGAFDDDATQLLQTFAGYAAVALANAHLYASTAALAKQMTEAMDSRAVIEQAKGILIAQRQVSADEAFDIMSRASQVGNRKLREIAAGIVAGAQAPANGHPHP